MPPTHPRAWEVAGNSGRAGVALEARAGPKALSLLSRGRPALVQAMGYSVGLQGASSGIGNEMRVGLSARSSVGRS